MPDPKAEPRADRTTDTEERLWQQLEAHLAAEGVELDDLDIRGSGRGRLVRVLVDAPGGLDVDRIAVLSKDVSRLLDDESSVAGSYTLEVSSPGLERALRRPRHFEKAVGREVDVRTAVEVGGATHHRGTLESCGVDSIRLEVDGSLRELPLRAISRAKTVFRWEKAPKPGGKRGAR